MHVVHLSFLAQEASKTLGNPMVLAGSVGINALSGLQCGPPDVAEGRNPAQPFVIFSAPSLRGRLRVFCAHRLPPLKKARLRDRRRTGALNVRDEATHKINDARIADGHVSSIAPQQVVPASAGCPSHRQTDLDYRASPPLLVSACRQRG
jgi:hypothetical protein